MSLPNPSMSFSPFAILTADEMNDLVENDQALAAGTGLNDSAITTAKIADNNVTAAKLATNAITLGYAQITTNFATSSTSPVQVTGLSTTVTIPAGGRRVKITAFIPRSFNGAISTVVYGIWDGAVGSGTLLASTRNLHAIAGNSIGTVVMAVVTPSAGSKTYNVAVNPDVNTETCYVDATFPAFILVEAI